MPTKCCDRGDHVVTNGCCFHDIERHGYSAGRDYSRTVVSQCCWCGYTKSERWESQQDPEHGPHAPKTLVRVP